jgi:isoleucyl-tRNA synthetase
MKNTKTHKIKEVESSPDFSLMEKELIEKWYSDGTLEKYLSKNNDSDKKFSFLDGPITANNPMGVHHAWGRTYKDLWQRFNNMRGFKQRFQNGFDCQGLWVEVEVEKELGFRTKKDIESFGVDKFVELCKQRVLKYSKIQTDQSKRLGYFMDWDNSYFTMSETNNYSIWNFLQICWQKGWIYKGHDAVPWCPRCETAISQHEMLTEDYKELTHKSIYLSLPIVDKNNEYLIIWTTTPWTIPANIAVSVDATQEYALVEGNSGDSFWVLKALVDSVFKDGYKKIVKTSLGSEIVGLHYTTPFDTLPAVAEVAKLNQDKFHVVVATDTFILPISNTEGTGMVHTATSAGTEDFLLGRKLGLPMIPIIGDNADYLPNLGFLSGQNAKKHPEIILDYLAEREAKGENWLFRVENYTHRYPACWRCKTELVWKVADEWYIAMDKVDPQDEKGRTLRQKMIDVAKEITWKPEFGLEREIDWLNNMHDWLISKKNRYWGLALPIWVCEDCDSFDVIGSQEELKKRASSGWDKFEGHTPHKPFIDEVTIKCSCGGLMHRIPDVGNPWLDAGIVPFSTLTDPKTGKVSYTGDKESWKEWFPADFITESFPGQFKNWFYALIAMSTVLEDTTPFKSVLGFATVVGEDGRPMHKSTGNSVEFNEGADKMGVDAMRWTFLRHNPERNLLFGYNTVGEVKRQFNMIIWNSYRYFANFAALENWQPRDNPKQSENVLDKWVLARLKETVLETTKKLEVFDAFSATNSIESFVQDFSLWYIRRSRDRVGPSAETGEDKENCNNTFYEVLDTLSRVLMPFTPYMSEMIYTNITGNQSVNLADWPEVNLVTDDDKKLISLMAEVRKICETGHSIRKTQNIPVKQPLSDITINSPKSDLFQSQGLIQLIKEELNIESVVFIDSKQYAIELNTNLTDDLIQKGKVREVVRNIQGARKDAGCRLDEKVEVVLSDWPKKFEDEIKRKALVSKLTKGDDLKIVRSN